MKVGDVIYCTKWFLSNGLEDLYLQEQQKEGENYVKVARTKTTRNGWFLLFNKDWHTNREAALNRALEMIEAKRKSLVKFEKKLDKLSAEVLRDLGTSGHSFNDGPCGACGDLDGCHLAKFISS